MRHMLENSQIYRVFLAHPNGPLRVVPLFNVSQVALLHGVRVDQSGQRPSVYCQPWNESAELCRCVDVHLKHCHGMGADGLVPQSVDRQLRDYENVRAGDQTVSGVAKGDNLHSRLMRSHNSRACLACSGFRWT